MTNGEYQELIAFLGRQFAAIDARFEAMGHRFDVIEQRLDGHDEKFREILGTSTTSTGGSNDWNRNTTPSFRPSSGSRPS